MEDNDNRLRIIVEVTQDDIEGYMLNLLDEPEDYQRRVRNTLDRLMCQGEVELYPKGVYACFLKGRLINDIVEQEVI